MMIVGGKNSISVRLEFCGVATTATAFNGTRDRIKRDVDV